MSEGADPVRHRRAPARGLGGLVLLLALALAGGVWVRDLHRRTEARRAFPQVEGRLAVAGVGGRVEIHRDARGVPHIEAGTLNCWSSYSF